jgi:hypothetical protein
MTLRSPPNCPVDRTLCPPSRTVLSCNSCVYRQAWRAEIIGNFIQLSGPPDNIDRKPFLFLVICRLRIPHLFARGLRGGGCHRASAHQRRSTARGRPILQG